LRLKLLVASLLILCAAIPVWAASLVLGWDASRDPKVVGYRIHYGTESGKYTQVVWVKGRLTTEAAVENIEEGKIYFFTITSCDANGKESAYSREISNAAGAATNQASSRPKIPASKKVVKTTEGKILPSR